MVRKVVERIPKLVYDLSVETNASSELIFISYASPDKARVVPIFEWLESNGYEAWMDVKRLKPGQNWDFEIKRALDKSTFFLAVISNASYDRRGYLQREIKIALDKLNEKLVDDIFIIPFLLDDDVPIPEQLKSIQAVRTSDPHWQDLVRDAIDTQIEKLGGERKQIQEQARLSWTTTVIRESWEGLPGYEVEIQLFDFHSKEFPQVAEISQYIRGRMLGSLFRERSVKFSRPSDNLDFGQDKFMRTNTYDAHSGEPVLKGKVLSIPYSTHIYGAGAAHGIYGFSTFVFVLDPLFHVENLAGVFEEPDKAFPIFQAAVRDYLSNVKVGESEGYEGHFLDSESIGSGTKSWDDFSSFVFHENELEVLFGAYHVTCFADGPQSSKIPYSSIHHLMNREIVNALEIQHLRTQSPPA